MSLKRRWTKFRNPKSNSISPRCLFWAPDFFPHVSYCMISKNVRSVRCLNMFVFRLVVTQYAVLFNFHNYPPLHYMYVVVWGPSMLSQKEALNTKEPKGRPHRSLSSRLPWAVLGWYHCPHFILHVKSYSPTITHDKIFVYNLCVL